MGVSTLEQRSSDSDSNQWLKFWDKEDIVVSFHPIPKMKKDMS